MHISRRAFSQGLGLTALSVAGNLYGATVASADGPIRFDLRYMDPGMSESLRSRPRYIRLLMTGPVNPEKSRLQIMGRFGVPRPLSPLWTDSDDPSILMTNFPDLGDDRYVVIYKVYSTSGEFAMNRAQFSLETQIPLSDVPPGWPPVRMEVKPSVEGTLVRYEAWLWNVSLRRTKTAVVRGLIPPGARLVRSYLWSDGDNPGKTDGTTVGWTLPISVPPSLYSISGEESRPYGPFGYVVDTAGMAPGTALVTRSTVDWSLWWDGAWWNNEPWEGEQHGLSVSEDVVLTIGPDGPTM